MELTVRNNKVTVGTGGKPFDPSLPTVVFAHGSGLDHRGWALQARWFAHHGFSVFAPDLPGHSLSEGDPLETIEDMSSWLGAAMDAADIKSAHLVGHSQGYLYALEFAANAPQRALSLTGIGTAASIPVNPALIETAQKSAAKAAEMMLQWGFGDKAQMGRSAVPGMQPIAIGKQIMAANPLAADLMSCANYDGSEAVARLKAPSHLILADGDKMTPMKAGRKLATTLGIEPDIVRGYGHMLPMEAPAACLEALKGFLLKQAH